jgi:hypothetical protein
VPSRPKSAARLLLGHWKSDRKRTLEYWAFPPKTSAATRALFTGPKFFGQLKWQFTPKQTKSWFEGEVRAAQYRHVWSNEFEVAIIVGQGTSRYLHHIHFDGKDAFYILAGKGNCEFFSRVRPNKSLKRNR